MTSTGNSSDHIKCLHELLQKTDTVIIGAGAGLSSSAGFTYTGKRFEDHFADFIQKYGFRDMYSGGFFPFDSQEEYWAYWSRYVFINRYADTDNGTYQRLFELVKDKDYFVLTTNVDHQFQKAGFDKQRLFYTQGDYGLFQCSVPCHSSTYDNEAMIRAMVEQQADMKIPTELIPHCPVCGKPMTMNTPGIMKYPFWQMTYQNPEAVYACVNYGEAYAPREIGERAICIDTDIRDVLQKV